MMLTGNSSRAHNPQQIAIDKLCNLVGNPDTTVSELEAFLAEEKMDDAQLNQADTTLKLRPVEHTAVSGNLAVFQYLIEQKNVSVEAEDSDNLIFFSSESHSSPEIRKYIFANNFWKRFNDDTTELHSIIWGGDPDSALIALETALDEDTSGDDLKNITLYLGIRCRLSPQDSLNISYEKMMGKKAFTEEDRITQEFCSLVSYPHTTNADIENFLAHNKIFDINRKNLVTGMRPVAHAVTNINSFIYLVENLNASLLVDEDFLSSNIMYRAKNCEAVKNYFLEKKLWKKMGNNTTKLHAYAWAGVTVALFAELEKHPHRISDLTTDNKSIYFWAASGEIRSAHEEWVHYYFTQQSNLNKWKRLRNLKLCEAMDVFNSTNFLDFPDGELSSEDVNTFFRGSRMLLESLKFHFAWIKTKNSNCDNELAEKFITLFDMHAEVLGELVNNQEDISKVLTSYYECACSAYNLILHMEDIEARRKVIGVNTLALSYYNLATTLVNCAEAAISDDADLKASADNAFDIYKSAQIALEISRKIVTTQPEQITETDFLQRIDSYDIILKDGISFIENISPQPHPFNINAPVISAADNDEQKPQNTNAPTANYPGRLFTSSSSSSSSNSSSSSSPPAPNQNDNTPRYI